MRFYRNTIPVNNDFGFVDVEPQIPNDIEIPISVSKNDMGFIVNIEGYDNTIFLLSYDLDWQDGDIGTIIFSELHYDIRMNLRA